MAFSLNEYGWKDVEVSVDGRILVGALGVKFSDSIERELLYGKGNKPLGVQDGNVKYEGELTIHQGELEKLIQATGNKGAEGLKNLTIVFSYSKEGRITTRTLIGCAATSIGEEYKQNDKFATVAVPFIFTEIVY